MELDAKTFDLIGALSEVDFPEHTVEVYRNEAYGFAAYTLEQSRRLAEIAGDDAQIKKIEKELAKLRKEAEKTVLKVTLRGISQDTRELILLGIEEEFPEEKDLLGRVKDNPKRALRIREELWKAQIVKVEDSEGRVAIPDAEGNAVRGFLRLGEIAVDTINAGLAELSAGTKAGYEMMTQDQDFLSKA